MVFSLENMAIYFFGLCILYCDLSELEENKKLVLVVDKADLLVLIAVIVFSIYS